MGFISLKQNESLIAVFLDLGIFRQCGHIHVALQESHQKGSSFASLVQGIELSHFKHAQIEVKDVKVLFDSVFFDALWNYNHSTLDQEAQQNLCRCFAMTNGCFQHNRVFKDIGLQVQPA